MIFFKKNKTILMICLIVVGNLLKFSYTDPVQDNNSLNPGKIADLYLRLHCSEGWILNSDSSKCFRAFNTTQTWLESVNFCRGYLGDLASLHSETDFILVKTLISEDTWIGLNDILIDGDMKWSDGSALDFTSWSSGEPNNLNDTENCVILGEDENFDFTVEDCNEEIRFVCEKKEDEDLPVYRCPQTWIMNSASSKCFHAINFDQTWKESLDFCRAFGGDLASLHSESDFVLAKSLVSADTWIGLNDILTEVMIWSDYSTFDYASWGPDQPDNQNNNESCVEMNYEWNFDFNDEYCNKKESFLCQKIPDAVIRCPEGWILNSDSSKCFGSINVQHTWGTSQDVCSQFGGDLASLHSEEDFVLAKSLLSGNTWIGLSDIAKEETFVWSDSSSLDYDRWEPGEPNDGGRHGEDCVEMKSSADYEFNDNDCSLYKNFLCETIV